MTSTQVDEVDPMVQSLKSARDFPAAKWFVLIWATGFLRQLQQDQKQRRVPVLERVRYLKEHEDELLVKSSKLTSKQLKEALRMETVVQSPAVSRLFTSYVASQKMRRKIQTAKKNARRAPASSKSRLKALRDEETHSVWAFHIEGRGEKP